MKSLVSAFSVGVVLLSVSAMPSLAATFSCTASVGTCEGINTNLQIDGSETFDAANLPKVTASFTDKFDFTLTGGYFTVASTLSESAFGVFNITSFDIWKGATDLGVATTAMTLGPGNYFVEVTGSWTGLKLGSFDSTLSVAAATPLPAALPLFAGGLGLLGGVTAWRKRRKVGSGQVSLAASA